MHYILEITTKIGCINMCEYCPQTKLVRRYLKNAHILKNNKHLRNKLSLNCKNYALKKFDTIRICEIFLNILNIETKY